MKLSRSACKFNFFSLRRQAAGAQHDELPITSAAVVAAARFVEVWCWWNREVSKCMTLLLNLSKRFAVVTFIRDAEARAGRKQTSETNKSYLLRRGGGGGEPASASDFTRAYCYFPGSFRSFRRPPGYAFVMTAPDRLVQTCDRLFWNGFDILAHLKLPLDIA